MKTPIRLCALLGIVLAFGLPALAQTTATPAISPGTGRFTGSQTVTITDSTPSSTIFYTLDGSTPLTGSPTYLFDNVITSSSAAWGKTCYVGSPQCGGGVGTLTPKGTPTSAFGLNTPTASTGTANAVAHFAFQDPQAGGKYTQVLWTSLHGASTTSGSATYITADFWEKAVFAAGKSNLEFDTYLSTSGWLFMFGTQCSGANGYKIQYDNEGHGWVTTGTACPSMVDGSYHHIIAKYYRDALTSTACSGAPCEHWISIQIDSTVTPLNVTLPATKTSWGEQLAHQFQIDGDPTTASSGSPALYDLYVDTDTLSASTTSTSTSPVYSAPLTITSTSTVKAAATASGYAPSAVASATYTLGSATAAPTFSPSGGAYTGLQYLTLADATSGAVIYYTTDGTAPTTSSSVYSLPLAIAATATVKAMAVAPGYVASSIVSATYTIGGTPIAATPTFSPSAGIYSGGQTVTISDSTPSSTIYYTTDGSTPTTASSVYSAPVTVSATATVKAIATASGYGTSAVGVAPYTIGCGAMPYATGNIDPTQIKAAGRLGAGPFFQMAAGGYTAGDLPDYDCNGNAVDSGTALSSLPTKSGVQQGSYTYAADRGSANAYAATLSPAPTIAAGSHVVFKAAHANTGASTLAVNGGTATPIKKQGATDLASGDIAAGQIVEVVYDGTNFQMLASGGSAAGSSPLTTKGDLYGFDTANNRVPVGPDGDVMTADSTQPLGLKWAANPAGFANPMTAAGDLIYGGTGGTPTRLPAGTNSYVLTSNGPAAAPSWKAATGSGPASPTIRGTGIQASSASSYTVSWPAGTAAGDLALIFFGGGYQIGSVPVGWTALDTQTGSNWNGSTLMRVLNSADITSGSVTVTSGGLYDATVAVVTLVGNAAVRTVTSTRNSSGSASITVYSDGSPLTTDMALYFGSNRGASTDSCSLGTMEQQSNDGSAASGALYAGSPGSAGGVAPVFSYSSSGSGNYQAIVVLRGSN